MSFLLLAQKKGPKKSAPAMIPIAIGTAIAGNLDPLLYYCLLSETILLSYIDSSWRQQAMMGESKKVRSQAPFVSKDTK